MVNLPKHITSEYKIPIVCTNEFNRNLLDTLLLYSLMNYRVRENPCLPEITIRLDKETYTCYEIVGLDSSWVVTIKLLFDQLKRHRKNLRTKRMQMTDTYNVLSQVILEIPTDEDPYSTAEIYDPNDEKIFERLKQLINI